VSVLVVTNDFPPVLGGIETFAACLTSRLPSPVVLTRCVPGSREADAGLPFPVVRHPVPVLLPTPRLAGEVADLVRRHRPQAVWFPSSAPLALLAGAARAAGARTIVASTHGHEVWWCATPPTAVAIRRIARSVDAVTYVSDHVRQCLAAAWPRRGGAPLVRVAPGVEATSFAPDPRDRDLVRTRLRLHGPVVLAVSRLVRRKGVDILLAAWPDVRRVHRGAHLLVVGDGPDRRRVARSARRIGEGVTLVGAVRSADMPAYYAAADVFALPVRSRWHGLEPEALGICFLEAAAAGLPVVVGSSGGTAETLVDGRTGRLVDGRDPSAVARAVTALLSEPETARTWGQRGRERVVAEWTWEVSAGRLRQLLRLS
jgi:phosphatidylinositol alpha-1,6-mannosyltransferase